MVTRYLHILCEGPTEMLFVNKVLGPYLKALGLYDVIEAPLLVTSKKKEASGGIISFVQVERDMRIMLKHWQDSAEKKHCFSTMFDYYALPSDFPGFTQPVAGRSALSCIEGIEKALANYFGDGRLIPYIELHEFEALVFCGLDYLRDAYPEADIDALKRVLTEYDEQPETINNSRETAPSKRIISVIEKKISWTAAL